jgi:hypothetical protein
MITQNDKLAAGSIAAKARAKRMPREILLQHLQIEAVRVWERDRVAFHQACWFGGEVMEQYDAQGRPRLVSDS